MMEFDAFISYSSQDKTAAHAACAVLESAGVRCWIAPRDIMAGDEYGAAIVEAIDRCRVMVLIFSASANNSGQIRREIERAASKGVAIVPLRIEQVAPTKSMEYFLGAIHWLDALTPPIETHLQKLAEIVKALLEVQNAARGASGGPSVRDKSSYAAQREAVAPKPRDDHDAKNLAQRIWLPASLAAVACIAIALAGTWHYRTRLPAPAPAPAVAPVAPVSQPAQKAALPLIPETVPFVRNVDRGAIRSEYLPAADHKALAISYNRIGFTTGQADDETAKAAAMDSCKRALESIKSANPCWLYALGNTVVFTGGTPPMPPAPWLIRNPAIETPYTSDNLPLMNENQRAHWGRGYAQIAQSKAMALSPRAGLAFDFYGGSDEENIRRGLESCGYAAGIPCMIVAVDNSFVVPIPVTMKVVGFFNANTSPAVAPEMRSALAEHFANATNAWNAVAVGAGGMPGTALNAADEKDAVEKALASCSKRDRDCRVIALGPFLVEPADQSREHIPPTVPPAEDKWAVELSNIDDYMLLNVDGQLIGRCEFLKTCTFDISNRILPAGSDVNIQLYNVKGGYTYGYKIIHNGVTFAADFCGTANAVGCDNNSVTSGLVKNFNIPITKNAAGR